MKLITVQSKAEFTRPNNTTDYSIGDAITDSVAAPTNITFKRLSGSNGRYIRINRLTIAKTGPSIPCLQLWLFDKDITAINDNTAFTVSDLEIKNCIAVINLFTVNTAVDTVYYDSGEIRVDVLIDHESNKLFGILKTLEAYTPIAQESHYLTLETNNLD